MTVRVAINGFGRIGRSILRALATSRTPTGIEIVRVNDIALLEACAYLFEFDSVFGPYPGWVGMRPGALAVDGRIIPFTHAPDLSTLDLARIDVVLECTGRAATRTVAERGLRAGAGAGPGALVRDRGGSLCAGLAQAARAIPGALPPRSRPDWPVSCG